MPNEPEYVEAVRQKLVAQGQKRLASRLDIERLILKQWKPEFSQFPATRCPEHIRHVERIEFPEPLDPVDASGWTLHFYHYVCLLFPNLVPTPELLRMIQAVEQTRLIEERKIINFIGHKNGSKTLFFTIISLALVTIDPEFSRAYLSGPYKDSAASIVWGRVGTWFNSMRVSGKTSDWLNHCRVEPSKDRYVIWPGSDEYGYLELITLDKVGKLQGAKSVNSERGWLIVICDEVNQFPTRAFIDVLENIKGNRNLIVLTGCNFKNIEGMDGDLCRPEGREFAELKIDFDYDWLSAYSSHTWRFDGHRASNVVAGRVIYPFLLDEKTRAESERDHGANGPKYLEQIRSFPSSGMSDYFVLTRERIRAGGGSDDTYGYWEGVTPKRVVFCDPGFGGDPCKIGVFRYGQVRVPTTDGLFITSSIFEPEEPFQTILLNVNQTADERWLNRLRRVAEGEMMMAPGQVVTLENQIAVQAAEYCRAKGVEYGEFGFDGSMRSAIVQEFCAVMGTRVNAIDPVGGPSERPLPFQQDRDAKDEYFNFVSEEYFNFASLVQARQFRGADMVPAAVEQICRRPWKWTGTKKQIQPKEQYKKDNQGRSPDDADVLVGGFEMALRKGFVTIQSRRPAHAGYAIDPESLMRHLGENPRFRRFGTKSLKT